MKTIKYILFTLAAFTIYPFVNAQNSSTTEFRVDGIKVIYKQSSKEIVSVRLFVEGGTANYPKEKEGIENFAFNLAVSGGTESRSKNEFNRAVERMGTSIDASTTYDYGQFILQCLKPYWETSWELFTDAILNPAFEEQQFGILKEQLIAAAKQAASDPDSRLLKAAMENVFEGMDYAKDPAGTEASLSEMSLDDLESYYERILTKKRISFVVVGDLDLADLKKKISNAFGSLPEGNAMTAKERFMFNEPKNRIEDRDIATNYIRGYMSAPKLDTEDGVPMMLAMSILSDRLFEEIRTKRGLSYAPQAFMPSGIVANPYNVIYVTTTDPKQSIEVIVAEINDLKKNGFTAEELVDKQQTYLTSNLMQQETLSAQSNQLGLMELKGGWEMMDSFTEDLSNVTLEDINRVIDKYTDVINWTYLGKEEMITEEDLLQPGKFPDNVEIKKD